MPAFDREYEPLLLALANVGGSREQRMHAAADVFWRFFKDFGVSWVGFYSRQPIPEGTPTLPIDDPAAPPLPETPPTEHMVLGPCRDKPACSPIGLHGACGMSMLKQRPIVVHDVRNLGPNYIACDPKDKAEIVLPLFDDAGACYGVLDVDSFDRSAFGESDVRGMKRILEATGISWPSPWAEPLYY